MNQVQNAKILYVDDEEINLKVFNAMFKNRYNIITAQSAETGLELLRNNLDIHLLITDMNMPNMSGLELIDIVKDLDKDIPCIILSGYKLNEDIRKAIESNIVCEYVMKPLIKSQIENLIDSYLS